MARSRAILTLLALLSPLLLLSEKAHASEGYFGYVYTLDTTPADHWEYEQKQTMRTGKARGSYTAVDLRNEFEYGVTDKFQAAFYINSSYNYLKNIYLPEDISNNLPDKNEFNVNGVSVEFIYRVLSPYKDGVGLGFYIEPEVAVRDKQTGQDKIERSLETRIILQKDFFGDQMVTAFNFMLEPEWEINDGASSKELWAEFTLGANYRVHDNWFLGVELRNHMEFTDMNLQTQEHSAYFAGVDVHYGGEAYWWTVTVLPQIAGWPRNLGIGNDGVPVTSSYAHLGQHENIEFRVAFGIPLGTEHSHAH